MKLTLEMIEAAKKVLEDNGVPDKKCLWLSAKEYYDPIKKKEYEDMFPGVSIELAGRIK